MNAEWIQRPDVPTSPRAFLRWFFAVPVRRQTWANQLYLWLAFPAGIAYFVVLLTGLVTSGVLVVLLVGIPLLVGMLYLVRELAAFERWLADRLLAVGVPARADPLPDDPRENLRRTVVNLRIWTGLAFLVSKFAVGLAVFVALVFMAAFSLTFLTVPLYYRDVRVRVTPPGGDISLSPTVVFELQTWQVALSVPFRLTSGYITSLPEALAVAAFGLVLAFVCFHLCNAIAWLLGLYARLMLGDGDRSGVRQLLDA